MSRSTPTPTWAGENQNDRAPYFQKSQGSRKTLGHVLPYMRVSSSILLMVSRVVRLAFDVLRLWRTVGRWRDVAAAILPRLAQEKLGQGETRLERRAGRDGEAMRAEHAARYPDDWKTISKDLRENRAKLRCECVGECGLHKGRRCEERHMQNAKWANGKVVLTTAHRNHKPEDCRPENLMVLCNRCHLRYDRFFHKVGKLEEQGQGRLIDWHPD